MLKYEPDEIIAGRLKYFENRLFPLFWRLDLLAELTTGNTRVS